MEFANDRAVGTMWGELFINHTKTGKSGDGIINIIDH